MSLPKDMIINFRSKASRPMHGLVMFFDLEGFSQFFNQPDLQDYIPAYLNTVFESIHITIGGGKAYWMEDKKEFSPLQSPSHVKYLGDGAMYIWTAEEKTGDFDTDFIIRLCNRLWFLKNYFPKINKKCCEEIPVAEVPQRIRFGLARGTLHELYLKDSDRKDYVGVAVNLANRLQQYCPDLGFIASARLKLPKDILQKNNYLKVVATHLKGFPKEIVIVDKDEYDSMDGVTRNRLFAMI